MIYAKTADASTPWGLIDVCVIRATYLTALEPDVEVSITAVFMGTLYGHLL